MVIIARTCSAGRYHVLLTLIAAVFLSLSVAALPASGVAADPTSTYRMVQAAHVRAALVSLLGTQQAGSASSVNRTAENPTIKQTTLTLNRNGAQIETTVEQRVLADMREDF
ncbi:hypothetical protein SCUP234_02557 [Seiridium cupressi]